MMRLLFPAILLICIQACHYAQPLYLHVLSTDPGLERHGDTLICNGSLFTGELMAVTPDGDTTLLEQYEEGIVHGVSRKWYTNGKIQEQRFYEQGRKTGIHTGFWENGKPRFLYEFSGGEHEGLFKEWYEDGSVYKEFHYQKGYENGSQRIWWPNGTVRANYVVKNGKRYGLIGLKLCSNPGTK